MTASSLVNVAAIEGWLTPGIGRTNIRVPRGNTIYSQADPADSVFLIAKGRVVLSMVSSQGKEAVVEICNTGEFFGEGCLFGQENRLTAAIALEPSVVIRTPRQELKSQFRRMPNLVEYLAQQSVIRNARMQEELAHQIFSNSEERLARILLLLSLTDPGSPDKSPFPRMSQSMLAAMVGTTRARISFFLGKFRKQGLVYQNRGLWVDRRALRAMITQ